jgi:transposase
MANNKSFIITKWCKSVTDSGKDETINSKPKDMPYKFRLLDDDGEVYAYGYSKTNDDDAAFNPLNQFMNSYGCTEIQYKNPDTGIYETL